MTDVIAALDVDTLAQAERLLERLRGAIDHYKIGLELFTAHGPRAVELVHRYGGKVFLDLKMFDIPRTVERGVRRAQELGVFSLSVHLWGGRGMLAAAASVSPRPKLWGVTVLTSWGAEDLRGIGPGLNLKPTVLRLAKLGKRLGLDGTICSAQEAPDLLKALGPGSCLITPGIRPAGSDRHDQKRVSTPEVASRLGVRYLVIGRPITEASSPREAALDILGSIQ